MFFNTHSDSKRQRQAKIRLIVGTIVFLVFWSVTPTVLLAEKCAQSNDQYGLETAAKCANLDTNQSRDIPTILGQGVNYLFGILGVVFLTVSLIGGYLWMTAGGNEEAVKKAKAFIINGINGMIVIFISYALVYLILAALRDTNGV